MVLESNAKFDEVIINVPGLYYYNLKKIASSLKLKLEQQECNVNR